MRAKKPLIRITVWDILGGGLTEPKILAGYPELCQEDIQAALQFAYRRKDGNSPQPSSTARV
jgi:uncharacterized protein (DUF433 family)